jgi:hypothetical protein
MRNAPPSVFTEAQRCAIMTLERDPTSSHISRTQDTRHTLASSPRPVRFAGTSIGPPVGRAGHQASGQAVGGNRAQPG